jgi:hypothetical protein
MRLGARNLHTDTIDLTGCMVTALPVVTSPRVVQTGGGAPTSVMAATQC